MRQIFILLFLLAVLQIGRANVVPQGIDGGVDVRALTVTGFLLLAAYALGELFRKARLPALLGYLAAGVAFGPSLARLTFGDADVAPLRPSVLEELGLINILAVGVIGTIGGGEIKIAELRENFRRIFAITSIVFALVLPAVFGVVLGLSFLLPTVVPFLADLPLVGKIAGSLLFAALAIGMSPSATLALLQEVRAHGPFTSLVLSVVVLADLLLVGTFLFILALSKLLISPEGVSVARVAEQLPIIAAEFGWALLIGLIVGLAFILYLRLVKRELLLFSLGIVFVASFVAARLHAETLLAFLVAGFIVQNLSPYGHKLIHAFERIALPVFVIYFATQAARLDLAAVTAYLPLTLVLVAVRCSLFFVGIGWATKLTRVDERHRRHLRISFFSQGGVDLVLAQLIADNIPGWGAEVQTVTMATILFYVVAGPFLLARALDAVGESAAARERGAESLEEHRRQTQQPQLVAEFQPPAHIGGELGVRLRHLCRVVRDMAERTVETGIVARAEKHREMVGTLAKRITAVLDEPVSASAANQPPAWVDIHEAITAAAQSFTPHDHIAIDAKVLDAMIDKLTAEEPFAATYRVVREPHLFEPGAKGWRRFVRALRRVRRSVLGPGMRSVPTGRLWRYHVAFQVPVALWSTLRPAQADLWKQLADHYKLTREDFERLQNAARSGGDDAAQTSGDDDSAAAPDERLAARERAMLRQEELLGALEDARGNLEQALLGSLAEAWKTFAASVDVAGTIEHSRWRYRISARYDTSQAARADLRERIERDLVRASGRRDALFAVAHGERLRHRALQVVTRRVQTIEHQTNRVLVQLDEAVTLCERLTAASGAGTPVDADAPALPINRAAYDQALAEVKTVIDEALARVELLRPQAGTDALQDPGAVELEQSLWSVPVSLIPDSDLGTRAEAARDVIRAPLRLRAWLRHTLVRELTVAFLSSDELTAMQAARVIETLQHARQVLEYHLGASTDAVDEGLGARLRALVHDARKLLEELLEESRVELLERVRRDANKTLEPLVASRWDEIRRQLRRFDDQLYRRGEWGRWLRTRRDNSLRYLRVRMRWLAGEVGALFARRTTPAEAESYRRLIFGKHAAMPPGYERLFTSVAAESLGLLVERPEFTAMRRAVDGWRAGQRSPILVVGDRGSGKRTVVRRVIADLRDEVEVRWLALGPGRDNETAVARAVSKAIAVPESSTFNGVAVAMRRAVALRDKPRPVAVVIESSERLFRRTPETLEPMRDFLKLVSATSRDVLWVLLIAAPAARLLDSMMELRSRAVVIDVGPLGREQMERAIMNRHRLSGYGLRIGTRPPRLVDWIRSPATVWRSFRDPEYAFYQRLCLLSAGNIRQALQLWLASVALDPADPRVAVTAPLLALPIPLLDGTPMSARIVLATLVIHGPLPVTELRRIVAGTVLDLEVELARLGQLGLVTRETRRVGPNRGEAVVTLTLRAAAPITAELRQCNLI